MQPAASNIDGTGVKLMKGDVLGGALAPMNEETFWKKRAEDVPVDQACLLYRCMRLGCRLMSMRLVVLSQILFAEKREGTSESSQS